MTPGICKDSAIKIKVEVEAKVEEKKNFLESSVLTRKIPKVPISFFNLSLNHILARIYSDCKSYPGMLY